LDQLPEQARAVLTAPPHAAGLAGIHLLPRRADEIVVVLLIDDYEVAGDERLRARDHELRRAAIEAARDLGDGAVRLVIAAGLDEGLRGPLVSLEPRLARAVAAQDDAGVHAEPRAEPIGARGREHDPLGTSIERGLDRGAVIGHAVALGVVRRVGHLRAHR